MRPYFQGSDPLPRRHRYAESSDSEENLEKYRLRSPTIPNSSKLSTQTLTMASRTASRALRASVAQLAKPVVQRRTFVAAASAVRAGATAAPRAAVSASLQQVRGVKTIDFAGTKEDVYGTQDSPRD